MKVFLSWSGGASRDLSRLLRSWLPYVVPNIKPWMSEDDIDKGAHWPAELARELAGTSEGIVCVTSDNMTSPWLNFEAGSLAKAVQDKTHLLPLLLDLTPPDIVGPLALYQATVATRRDDVFKLVRSLNSVCEDPHPDERMNAVFGRWWDDFADGVATIIQQNGSEPPSTRTDRDLLEEILTLIRGLPRQAAVAGRSGEPAGFPRVSSIER